MRNYVPLKKLERINERHMATWSLICIEISAFTNLAFLLCNFNFLQGHP